MKYLTKKGISQYEQYRKGEIELKDITGISKKGYQEYKNYITFLSNIENIMEAYGYETIKQYAVESKSDPKRAKVIERLLFKIYSDNAGKGLTQAEMASKFTKALSEYDKRQTETAKLTKDLSSFKAKKDKTSKGSTIKVKTVGKMRTHGTVRGKFT